MDAATAVSGVAPAYVALIAEAWVDAAVGQGIPAAQAAELVADSLAGSAALLLAARNMDTLGGAPRGDLAGRDDRPRPARARAGGTAQRVQRRRGRGRRAARGDRSRPHAFASTIANYISVARLRLHAGDHRLHPHQPRVLRSGCGSPTRAGATRCSASCAMSPSPTCGSSGASCPSFGGLDFSPIIAIIVLQLAGQAAFQSRSAPVSARSRVGTRRCARRRRPDRRPAHQAARPRLDRARRRAVTCCPASPSCTHRTAASPSAC